MGCSVVREVRFESARRLPQVQGFAAPCRFDSGAAHFES